MVAPPLFCRTNRKAKKGQIECNFETSADLLCLYFDSLLAAIKSLIVAPNRLSCRIEFVERLYFKRIFNTIEPSTDFAAFFIAKQKRFDYVDKKMSSFFNVYTFFNTFHRCFSLILQYKNVDELLTNAHEHYMRVNILK